MCALCADVVSIDDRHSHHPVTRHPVTRHPGDACSLTQPDEDVRRLIKAGRLERLLEGDQLRREMAAGRAFKVGGGG